MDRKASTPRPAVGQKKVDNREKPRLAQAANIDAEKLLEWFDWHCHIEQVEAVFDRGEARLRH
jgi:hypothetical protein